MTTLKQYRIFEYNAKKYKQYAIQRLNQAGFYVNISIFDDFKFCIRLYSY